MTSLLSKIKVALHDFALVLPYSNFITCTSRHGLARSGTEYGPLTDLPDWSFAGIDFF